MNPLLPSNLKKIVIKIGSAVLTEEEYGINREVIENIAFQVRWLKDLFNSKFVIVSSGAIAYGKIKLGFKKSVLSLPEKQALASVGQADLIKAYEEVFQKEGFMVSQVLLTQDDLCRREKFLNAKKTLATLLKWEVIPIINENDTVATQEIKFGDNDILSAFVSGVVEADFLIILSEVDALYTKDPRFYQDAEKIFEVKEIDEEIFKMAGEKPGKFGRGGMLSKLKAAKIATSMGIPVLLLSGKERDSIIKFFKGEKIGTFFYARARELPMRKLWIKYYTRPEGEIIIDEGASKALISNGKSLLLAGICGVVGTFKKGDCVDCVNERREKIARGIVNFSSYEIENLLKLKNSLKIDKEIIHRDNLVLL